VKDHSSPKRAAPAKNIARSALGLGNFLPLFWPAGWIQVDAKLWSELSQQGREKPAAFDTT
jgi:hypothetical protein